LTISFLSGSSLPFDKNQTGILWQDRQFGHEASDTYFADLPAPCASTSDQPLTITSRRSQKGIGCHRADNLRHAGDGSIKFGDIERGIGIIAHFAAEFGNVFVDAEVVSP